MTQAQTMLELASLHVDTSMGLIGTYKDGSRRIIKCEEVLAFIRATTAAAQPVATSAYEICRSVLVEFREDLTEQQIKYIIDQISRALPAPQTDGVREIKFNEVGHPTVDDEPSDEMILAGAKAAVDQLYYKANTWDRGHVDEHKQDYLNAARHCWKAMKALS